MHASRKWVQLTTAALWFLAAACSGSTNSGSDGGDCANSPCTSANQCPTLTCTCGMDIVGFPDGGGQQTQTKKIAGECTGGCCAPCPADCM